MINEKLMEEKEARAYYCYMLLDGILSDDEEEVFSSICKSLGVKKNEIIKSVKERLSYSRNFDPNNIDTKILIDIIQENLGRKNSLMYWFGPDSARIVWNLIFLGYADNDLSEEEKNVVEFYVKFFKIKKGLYAEMIDTADTILTLENQKKWAQTKYSGERLLKKQADIDSKIQKLATDMNISISEVEY